MTPAQQQQCGTQQQLEPVGLGVLQQSHQQLESRTARALQPSQSGWSQHLVGGAVVGAAAVAAAKAVGGGPPWTGLGTGACPLAVNLW